MAKKWNKKHGGKRVNERTPHECSYVHARRVLQRAHHSWCAVSQRQRFWYSNTINPDSVRVSVFVFYFSRFRFIMIICSLYDTRNWCDRRTCVCVSPQHSYGPARSSYHGAMIRCIVHLRQRVFQCNTNKNVWRFPDATRERQWPNRKCVQEIKLGSEKKRYRNSLAIRVRSVEHYNFIARRSETRRTHNKKK